MTARAFDPQLEALAFRIWQVAEPRGWRVSPGELAAMLGEPVEELRVVLRAKGWTRRVAPDAAEVWA